VANFWVATIPFFTLLLISIRILRSSLPGLRTAIHERNIQHGTNTLVQDYIETGQFSHKVASLDSRSLQAALDCRANRIRERTKANHDFHAVSICPACTRVDLHEFDSVIGETVHRKCKYCGYRWEQE
jgi:hypothetical protein